MDKGDLFLILFSRLEKAFTRVVSSLIVAFKSLMSLALFGCLLARPCLEALKLALLVADRILFSTCSCLCLTRSGNMVVNFCLRALMAFLVLDHELGEVPFCSYADLLQVSVEVLVRSGPALETNRA